MTIRECFSSQTVGYFVMELLGRGREIVVWFAALVCAIFGYNTRCRVVKERYLHPDRLGRTLVGVDSRVACVITCLKHDLCQGVYHDRLTSTCRHYDLDTVYYGRPTRPDGNVVMVYCDNSTALTVTFHRNVKFLPGTTRENVRASCQEFGGKRLATIGELGDLRSNGFVSQICCWTDDGTRMIFNGSVFNNCSYVNANGYCRLN